METRLGESSTALQTEHRVSRRSRIHFEPVRNPERDQSIADSYSFRTNGDRILTFDHLPSKVNQMNKVRVQTTNRKKS